MWYLNCVVWIVWVCVVRACAQSHVENLIMYLRLINDCDEPQPKCQFGTLIVTIGTIGKFSSIAFFFFFFFGSFLHPNLISFQIRLTYYVMADSLSYLSLFLKPLTPQKIKGAHPSVETHTICHAPNPIPRFVTMTGMLISSLNLILTRTNLTFNRLLQSFPLSFHSCFFT